MNRVSHDSWVSWGFAARESQNVVGEVLPARRFLREPLAQWRLPRTDGLVA